MEREEYLDQIETLLDGTWGLPHGAAKIAVLEEAVRIADAHNDPETAYEVRMELLDAATFGGRPDLTLVVFAWCLAAYDKDPDSYDEYDMLWKYKWVVGSGTRFPQIPRAKLDELLADMLARFKKGGHGLHGYWQTARKLADDIHDADALAAAEAGLAKTRNSDLSDCAACDANTRVRIHLGRGDVKKAEKAGEKLLAGTMSCAEVPHVTYSLFLMPYFELGRLEEAADFHRRGYAMCRDNPEFVPQWGEHLEFVAVTDNLERGTDMLRRHLADAVLATSPDDLYMFLSGVALLAARLAAAGKASIRLRVPKDCPLSCRGGWTPVAEIADWANTRAAEIAAAFDARNGNGWYAARLAKHPTWLAKAAPFPLDAPKARKKPAAKPPAGKKPKK